MANRSGQKIRLVKCPKCLKILQEDEDVPVYRCGACSAILQAEKQNIATNSTPSTGETERAQASEPRSEPETNNKTPSSLDDLEKNEEEEEEEDKSKLESDVMNTVIEAVGSCASSGSLSVDHVVTATENSPDASSPVEEKQDQLFDENEQWNDLQTIRSDKFEMPRNRVNHKEQGASSSSNFSEKRRNGFTTYREWNQTMSQQLEGQGRFLGRQGRRYVTEQLRPNMPFYPRKPYQPSHDEIDHYSCAYSLQMPLYNGRMNQECVARGYGRGVRFSREMTCDTRNHTGYYTSQVHNSYCSYSASPNRPMQQQHEYYQRWRHNIVSDHHELQQSRGLKERQRVAKHHVRSKAGGAPFVSCYCCYETLQLPVDFLILKKKYHMLRCGTCNTVLRFSLQSRTHLVPAILTHDMNVTNKSSISTLESASVVRGSPLHRLMGYSTLSQVFKSPQRPPSL